MIQVFVLFCLALQVQPAAPAFSPEERAALQSGIDAEKRGDLDQAITAFRKAADLAPADAIAFLRLGDAYMKKRDYGEALAPLKRATELSPNSLPAHQLLGYALLAQGYASEAIPHLQMVHEYGALGIAQLQAGQYADAVANLKAALDKAPNDPDLLYYLGRAGSSLASASQEKLLSAFPQTVRWHQALGQNYYAIKMLPEAEKEYEQALAMRPDLPGLRLELGQIYAASSQWDKAEEEFRGEAKLQPGSAEAAYRLGEALLQQGKMEEAASELRRSDQLRPDMPETLYAFGRATTVSDPRSAEHALGRVIELEKESYLAGQAYLLLAGIHRKQGKTEQAAHDMQEYRRIQALNERMVDKKSPS